MNPPAASSSFILGVCLVAGLTLLGFTLGEAALKVKDRDRSVVVKGLSEQEVPADVVIWPLTLTYAGDDLAGLYEDLEQGVAQVRAFLLEEGLAESALSFGLPQITDKTAQSYGNALPAFRFSGTQTLTVYAREVNAVREIMQRAATLGKSGIPMTAGGYQNQVQYLFTGLNALKPGMIAQATRNAREVAEKFAEDSNSHLGKIKRASQGQFSVADRDSTTPHIKKVRVVSTVEYFLAD